MFINSGDFELPAPPTAKSGWPWLTISPTPNPELRNTHTWPRITVVTPSYNQGQFIEETIRSVLLQGYPNLEYIVIDGGSTDGSVEIIEKYEPWLAYWVSEEDRGQSHALNKGFARSTGEIMAWLCSDDVYAPGTLLLTAEKLLGKQRAMLIGASVVTYELNKLEGPYDNRKPTYDAMLYEGRTLPQPSVFWTRDLWNLVSNIDEDLFFAMDYDLWLRMVPHALQQIYSDQILSYARTHSEQKGSNWRTDPVTHQRIAFTRAYIAIRAAGQRGEPPAVWLVKSWMRRLVYAVKRRQVSLLRGSALHRAGLRLVLSPTMREQKEWLK